MDLTPEAGVREAGAGLEGIGEGVVVGREAGFEEAEEEEGGRAEEGVAGVGLEHGVEEDEVREGEGGEETSRVIDGAGGSGEGEELGDEDGVMVEGSVVELGLDLLELVEAEIRVLMEDGEDGFIVMMMGLGFWERRKRW